MTILSTREAAELLGVSGATVRNWCRAGHMFPALRRPLSFDERDVRDLKARIESSRFNRLRKRANKSASGKTELPAFEEPRLLAAVREVETFAAAHSLDHDALLYRAALVLLTAEGERVAPPDSRPDAVVWRRRPVAVIMEGWARRLAHSAPEVPARVFDAMLAHRGQSDCLGILYQGLAPEGARSRVGAYFTPQAIIDDALADIDPAPASFVDPCCGTGRYLLRAAWRFRLDPARLHGFDSDPVSVDIARLNLLLHYRDIDFVPHVHCLDSLADLANGNPDCLTNRLLGGFDAVATNPPWGGCKNLKRNRRRGTLIRSGESFSLFLEKSLQLLRDGGVLSFILPESFLKIKAHADLRRLIVRTASIKKISLLGRIFPGVFTPVVRLDLEKKPPHSRWTVTIARDGREHRAPQSRFADNVGHAFDVAVTPPDEELLRKLYSRRHATLSGGADWALGIVTGDNARFVLQAPGADTEPVLRGRDIFEFSPRPPACHIRYQPENFQQVAPLRFFRAPEKLVYRFVSDRLIFAYDDKGLLTLNSANILIPRLPGMSIKVALAFLNSRVFRYIFCKRFRTRKILRGDLETLPFPLLERGLHDAIEARVDECIARERRADGELESLVARAAFGLDDGDMHTIERGVEAEAESFFL